MSPTGRQTRNILLTVFSIAALATGGFAYVFWPTLQVLLNPGNNGAHSIPSESMAPTLLPGDHVTTIDVEPTAITRGTVIIFKLKNEDRVSRIAGLPGDTIEMRNGIVYLNGRAVGQRRIGPGPPLTDTGASVMLAERFPGEERSHHILDRGLSAQDDFPATPIPSGAFFVLGDNRDNTADSRIPLDQMGAGMVAFRQVVGRVESRYWAKDSARVGQEIDPAPSK